MPEKSIKGRKLDVNAADYGRPSKRPNRGEGSSNGGHILLATATTFDGDYT